MKAKFGAIVVDGRGKIGGHVMSKNRAGAYMRTKVTPVNPQTSYQLAVRSRLTNLSQGWRSLTADQRAAWNGAVGNFARTDIFGDIKNPSGFNLYQRLNGNLGSIAQTLIDEPPLPGEVAIVTMTGITVETPSTVSVTTSGPVPAGTSLKVFATAPQSAGKSFVKSEFRQIGVIPASGASPQVLSTMYLTKFGEIQEGQKVFVRFVFVNNATGQESAPQQLEAIATSI